MTSAPCPKCRRPIETWDRAHKNRECIANLSADVEAHGNRIDALERKLAALGFDNAESVVEQNKRMR